MAETGPAPPQLLISMKVEDRRKLLLESLRPGYPRIPAIFRPISVNESRYITQFSSCRWRESIHQSGQVTNESDTVADDDDSSSSSEPDQEEVPQKLIIYGYDLRSEAYRRESEMIMRWNIVERDQHFPNLEKGYMDRQKAKNQVKDQAVGEPHSPPSRDVAMEERQVSPTIEDLETSPKSIKVADGSNIYIEDISKDVVMEESPESPKPELKDYQESKKTVPEACQESSKVEPQTSNDSPKIVSASEGLPNTVPHANQEPTKLLSDVCKESSVGALSVLESEAPEIPKTSECLKKETDDSKDKASVPDDDSKQVNSSVLEDSKQTKMSSESDDSKLAKSSAVPEDSKVTESSVAEDSKMTKRASESDDSKLAITSYETDDSKLAKSSAVPEDSKVTESSVAEDSKMDKRAAESGMETSGATSRGKRKAESDASIEGEDHDEKRTRKTSGDK